MTEEPIKQCAGDLAVPAPAEEPGSQEITAPFVAEVLVSAGPRKSAFEYEGNSLYAELCEDCAGTCWIGDRLVFWLCDGASNGMVVLPLTEKSEEETPPPVFGFSARILAQDLGQAFVQHFIRAMPKTLDLLVDEPPASAFADVVKNWGERFAEVVSRIELRGAREVLLRQLPEVLEGEDQRRNQVTWSSTFVGGVFDVKQRTAAIINFGDSAALVFTEPLRTITPNTTPVFMTARIEHATPLKSSVRLECSQTETWRFFNEVEGFALVSDGIDRDLSTIMRRLEEKDLKNLVNLRTVLLQKADVTWDDKSIVFCRFQS